MFPKYSKPNPANTRPELPLCPAANFCHFAPNLICKEH